MVEVFSKEGIRYVVSWSDLGEFCKIVCRDYVSRSDETKRRFEEFAKNYVLFDPWYDFMRRELQFECKILTNNGDDLNLVSVLMEAYQKLGKRVDDLTLGREFDNFKYKEGFLLRDGSRITLTNFSNHRDLAVAYLFHTFLEYPSYLEDFWQCSDKLVWLEGYMYFRLGIVMFLDDNYRAAIYDKDLINDVQRDFLSKVGLDLTIQKEVEEMFSNPFKEEGTSWRRKIDKIKKTS